MSKRLVDYIVRDDPDFDLTIVWGHVDEDDLFMIEGVAKVHTLGFHHYLVTLDPRYDRASVIADIAEVCKRAPTRAHDAGASAGTDGE